MDLQHYKFERFDGLPPDGEPGQFFGFDKDGRAFILRWVRPQFEDGGFWGAIGFEAASGHSRRDFEPVSFQCRGDHRITHWAAAPHVWPADEAAATA
jgi:hypothetical protein